MNHLIIEQMVKALRPVLKDRVRAEKILANFWRNRMALVWEITDVHRAANERGLCLTNQEARDVLANLHDHYNPQLGIRWEDIYGYLEAKGLGRKLTKHELNQFVQKDSLTINR